jgi:4-amino-4-deoxy-L-arabinose transferase-like glycosyltransferase
MLKACHNRAGHYALLLAAGSVLFLLNLGGATLWDLDEGRNATCAAAMWESGNWIIPTFNGALRVDKPALLYWLQMAAYQFFGSNEFAARLPSALAALLTLLLCYELGRRMFTPITALLAGLMVASTPMLCAAARFANPDSLLNGCTVLTLFLFWRGLPKPGWFSFAAGGVSTGLGMLAKGPVGLMLPLTVIGLFLLWTRNLRLLLDRRLFLGVLTFCLVALPWYILVGAETKGEFIRGFFLNHNFLRARYVMEKHDGSLLFYPVILLVGLAPWSIFLGMSFWYGGWSVVKKPWCRLQRVWSAAADRQSADSRQPTADGRQPTADVAAYRFLFCWIAVYLVFFSLAATKLPNYILPAAVPCALLMARCLDRWRQGLIQPLSWIMPVGLIGLALVGVCISFGMLLAGGAVRLTFMHHHYVQGMEWWAFMGLVPCVGVFLAWRCLRRQNPAGVIAWVAAASIAFLAPLAGWATETLNRYKPTRPLVEQAGARCRDREIRIGCWQLDYLPSLNFYCQRDVLYFQSAQDAADFLRYPIPVYLFVPEKHWQNLEKQVHTPHRVLARHRDLYGTGYVVVVSNQ